MNPAAPVATTTSSDAPPGKQQQASGAFVAGRCQPAKPKCDSQKATHTFIPKGARPPQPKLSEPVGDSLVVKGRVNDPQGQPVAAADVLVVSDYWDTLSKKPPVATAQSGADGRFKSNSASRNFPRGCRRARLAARRNRGRGGDLGRLGPSSPRFPPAKMWICSLCPTNRSTGASRIWKDDRFREYASRC